MDHDELAVSLRRAGAGAEAAEIHGSLCARLCLRGQAAVSDWLEEALHGTDPRDALRAEAARALAGVYAEALDALAGGDMEFSLLLPADDQPLPLRAAAIGLWAQGFLHGLGRSGVPEPAILAERYAAPHVAEFMTDLAEIARAGFESDASDEGLEQGEVAYAELVEFLRVGVQMSFEELAELREAALPPSPAKSS
jgi:uncharacterized protein YgfB (UPF0149 family)